MTRKMLFENPGDKFWGVAPLWGAGLCAAIFTRFAG
jgi:hypothetical protein